MKTDRIIEILLEVIQNHQGEIQKDIHFRAEEVRKGGCLCMSKHLSLLSAKNSTRQGRRALQQRTLMSAISKSQKRQHENDLPSFRFARHRTTIPVRRSLESSLRRSSADSTHGRRHSRANSGYIGWRYAASDKSVMRRRCSIGGASMPPWLNRMTDDSDILME